MSSSNNTSNNNNDNHNHAAISLERYGGAKVARGIYCDDNISTGHSHTSHHDNDDDGAKQGINPVKQRDADHLAVQEHLTSSHLPQHILNPLPANHGVPSLSSSSSLPLQADNSENARLRLQRERRPAGANNNTATAYAPAITAPTSLAYSQSAGATVHHHSAQYQSNNNNNNIDDGFHQEPALRSHQSDDLYQLQQRSQPHHSHRQQQTRHIQAARSNRDQRLSPQNYSNLDYGYGAATHSNGQSIIDSTPFPPPAAAAGILEEDLGPNYQHQQQRHQHPYSGIGAAASIPASIPNASHSSANIPPQFEAHRRQQEKLRKQREKLEQQLERQRQLEEDLLEQQRYQQRQWELEQRQKARRRQQQQQQRRQQSAPQFQQLQRIQETQQYHNNPNAVGLAGGAASSPFVSDRTFERAASLPSRAFASAGSGGDFEEYDHQNYHHRPHPHRTLNDGTGGDFAAGPPPPYAQSHSNNSNRRAQTYSSRDIDAHITHGAQQPAALQKEFPHDHEAQQHQQQPRQRLPPRSATAGRAMPPHQLPPIHNHRADSMSSDEFDHDPYRQQQQQQISSDDPRDALYPQKQYDVPDTASAATTVMTAQTSTSTFGNESFATPPPVDHMVHQVDQDSEVARFLQRQEETQAIIDSRNSVLSERSEMLSTTCGRAILFVETLCDAWRQVVMHEHPSVKAAVRLVIRQEDIVPRVERLLEIQEIYQACGKPHSINLGYYYTARDQLPHIRKHGMRMHRPSQQHPNAVFYNEDGTIRPRTHIFGDGVYTSTAFTRAFTPPGYNNNNNIAIFVARLTGKIGTVRVVQPSGKLFVKLDPRNHNDDDFDSLLGNHCIPSDTFPEHGHHLADQIVLKTSEQCLPLIEFPIQLKSDLIHHLQATLIRILDSVMNV
eukprot:CAMPEP_0119547284 /NCGR_PEP_ID=MMETSP1352-20130426/1427_1 /TAXON_ID=265584 /ORGANISM="Stauroneis constricta, Strain CCMP1120" /LENGTH=895 /DNA_ID=CAMNT_0007592153 /DNA_START=62 /DNA_END=2749 /DNA_ORIENTATION=+